MAKCELTNIQISQILGLINPGLTELLDSDYGCGFSVVDKLTTKIMLRETISHIESEIKFFDGTENDDLREHIEGKREDIQSAEEDIRKIEASDEDTSCLVFFWKTHDYQDIPIMYVDFCGFIGDAPISQIIRDFLLENFSSCNIAKKLTSVLSPVVEWEESKDLQGFLCKYSLTFEEAEDSTKLKEYPALSRFVAELLWFCYIENYTEWVDFSDLQERIEDNLCLDDELRVKLDDDKIWNLLYEYYLNQEQAMSNIAGALDKTGDNYFLSYLTGDANKEFESYKSDYFYNFLLDTSDFSSEKSVFEIIKQDFDSNAIERFAYELITELEEKNIRE